MKQIIKTIIVIAFYIGLSLPIVNAQKVYRVADVPNVHLQDRNAYVSDPEQKLAKEDVQELNEWLRFFEDSLGVQCAVIVVPAINIEPSDFAHDLLNKWGVGDKDTDRGLVFLLVYGDGEGTQRDIYMATGYGLEGDLPDVLCKHIQMETMVPLFKEEKFGEGLIVGILETKRLLENEEEKLQLVEQIKKQETKDALLGFGIFGIFGFLVFFALGFRRIKSLKNAKDPFSAYVEDQQPISPIGLGCLSLVFLPMAIPYFIIMRSIKNKYVYHRLHCKKCGSYNMKKPTSKITKKATYSSTGTKLFSFVCEDCNHIHHEKLVIPRKIRSSSSSSGSSSSSSSSGGSWGGGSSGGGGAGSSF